MNFTPTFPINDPTIVDIECYRNFWLFCARNIRTGKVIAARLDNLALVSQVMSMYTTISFNGLRYDLLMIVAALNGYTENDLKNLSDEIIQSGKASWMIAKERKLYTPPEWDHVDIIEVAPGTMASLKIYGGRMHSQRMQDLPYPHDAILTDEQKQVVTDYCGNDLLTTEDLFKRLAPQIDLRIAMSEQYGIDLRSKSDAQIAEAVLKQEALRTTATVVRKIEVPVGSRFKYNDPGFLKFKRPDLQSLFAHVLTTDFVIADTGSPELPEWLKLIKIAIGNAQYQMGIGGLHSQEACQKIEATDDVVVADYDVASFYPNIILQQKMFPPGVGEVFLSIYQSIVDRRISAKRSGDRVTADSLKITLNGTFGKLGSKYSFLYAPQQLIQVTITGQLALLYLIEMLHAAGVSCKSANTDGIVLQYHKHKEFVVADIMAHWQQATGYELERTDYRLLAARDVNNYVAVTTDGKIKRKGVFAPAGLMKNPDREIVYDAVAEHVANGADVEHYIRSCQDLRKFFTVRTVKGGAVWNEQYLGKAIRFYHSSVVPKEMYIKYQTNGNKVPLSDGCRPMMDLPGFFPNDIDYEYYTAAAKELLQQIGYY